MRGSCREEKTAERREQRGERNRGQDERGK